jgi:tRNA modification GTPase
MKTIVALSTPPLNAAVHIIRISGTEAFNIINQITTTKILKIGYKIQKTKIIDNQQIIDNVLINTFVTPQSYTGEDLVEINCHGGYFLANKIIELLIKHGCVLALPGEFTQRAFMNNKLTLIEAESINNLINTTSTQGILLANNGLHPQVIMKMHEFKNTLFNLLGQIEINIDYPEYDDVPNISNTEFKKQIKSLINTSQKIINDSMMALPIFEGINVTIIGQPNVGKSSLFNAILKESRAIVSSIPGTTRDVVSAKVNIGGVTINLQDTAGLRISKNTIEKLGILKTHESLSKSALII